MITASNTSKLDLVIETQAKVVSEITMRRSKTIVNLNINF